MTADNLTQAVAVPSFTERTTEVQAGPCKLVVLPTVVDDVVSFAGAIRSVPDLNAGEGIVQELMTLLLDKGTAKRDRFAVAELIDNRGAQIHFRSSPLRVTFTGRAMREDLPDVLSLLSEQLREPLFDEEEFEKAKLRLAATLRRSNENTGARAGGALSRLIFQSHHPNHNSSPETELARLASVSLADVRRFYKQHIGANEATMVVVGDVRPKEVETVVSREFDGWLPTSYEVPSYGSVEPGSAQELLDRLPEKRNVDVRLGHAIPVRRDHEDYVPLYLGTFILGGNFSARLMNIVRDQMGLTYGIGATLSGASVDYTGYFRVAVTLSPDKLDQGLNATREVIDRFVRKGALIEELDEKKETIKGSFVVELGTTGGLAYSLLVNHLRGFGTEYLDGFRDRIEAVTLDQMNSAVRRYLVPEKLHAAMSGALTDDH
jgi:zinc protease